MKKFFQKVKLDAKFRTAGEGHRLNEPNRSGVAHSASEAPPVRQHGLSESQANAAIAAIERQEKSKGTGRKAVKLPEDSYHNSKSRTTSERPPSSTSSLQSEPVEYSVDGVKFVSALTGDILPERDLQNHYRENLIMKLGTDEALHASCLMIVTLTKDRMKVDAAVKTLSKYLDNIISNEAEEKYRKIRKGNKVFSEKVATVDGAEEFLNAVGFKLTPAFNANNEEELYFILPSDVSSDLLKEANEILSSSQPLESKLSRDTKVYRPSDHIMKFNLPSSFYNLTVEEMKRQQGLLTEEVELNQQLRTKAMREKPKTRRNYKYALLRVKFPDGYILQGTFGVYEKLGGVRTFISENISTDWVPFTLRTSLGKELNEDDETLLSLSLIPSAVLNLSWLPDIQAQLHEQGITVTLKENLIKNTEELC